MRKPPLRSNNKAAEQYWYQFYTKPRPYFAKVGLVSCGRCSRRLSPTIPTLGCTKEQSNSMILKGLGHQLINTLSAHPAAKEKAPLERGVE